MKTKFNILITAAGVATAGNVITALRSQDELKIRIIAVDSNPMSYGLYLADKFYIVPKAGDRGYIPKIMEICKKEEVDLIIPLWSGEIPVYAKEVWNFEKIGVRLDVPDPSIVRTCMDKFIFYQFLMMHNIPTPSTYLPDNIKDMSEFCRFPLFTKRRVGSSSKDIKKVMSFEELKLEIRSKKDMIVQEFLEGKEYTIDLLAWNGNIIAMVPRERIETKDGKAVKSMTVRNDEIMSIVNKLISDLNFNGPANVQGIMTERGFKITEINPRFAAGGLPLTVKAGVNLPLLLIKDMFNIEIEEEETKFVENLVMLRYLTEVYIEKRGDEYAIFV